MKSKTLLRSLLATSLLTGLSACGGGGGGGGGGSDRIVQPSIRDVSMNTLQSRTGASEGEVVAFSDTALMIADGEGGTQTVSRSGQIVFTDSDNGRPGVQATFDANGDGIVGGPDQEGDIDQFTVYNPENNPTQDRTGEKRVQFTDKQAGGDTYRRAADVRNFEDQTIVYVPKDEAQKMYAGMYTRTLQAAQASAGQTGIWGRETTRDQMDPFFDAQEGTLSYDGFSQATMARRVERQDGLYDEGGFYEGTASATVDLGTNTLAAQAALSPKRGAVGQGQITMNTQGAYGRNGSYDQSAQFDDLAEGQTVQGSANGEFYGPNAETLGMTFRGSGGGANIAGGMIVNRSDD